VGDGAESADCDGTCDVGDGAESADCDGLCGGAAEEGSADCDGVCEDGEEATVDCPVSCEVSDWGEWGMCSAECGGGTQTRSRTITTEPANGGQPCPTLGEQRACNTDPCPVDCQVSEWSDWSACSAECGEGTQTRTRTITTEPENGGEACPWLDEQRPCNPDPCPVDCQVSEWSDWSVCSVECGGGTQSRSRSVTAEPENGGAACPALEEQRDCNTDPCPT
jgi:hypothetical protein